MRSPLPLQALRALLLRLLLEARLRTSPQQELFLMMLLLMLWRLLLLALQCLLSQAILQCHSSH